MQKFIAKHREVMPQEEQKLIVELRNKGMQINDLTPEQKKPFVEAAHSIYNQFKGEIGEDVISLAEKVAK